MNSLKRSTLVLYLLTISCGTNNTKDNDSNKSTNFKTIDFKREYNLTNKEYGTKTSVNIKDGKRMMKTNALPNHQVT